MRRKFIRAIVRWLINLLSRLNVVGSEYIPKQGAFLLATNHLSRFDAPVVFASVEREDLTGLAANTYRDNILIRWLVDAINGIWLNRDEVDIQALRAAREHLKHGGALGIAPEGTRSHSGALMHAKTGAAYLADKARVEIIPVGISGTEKAWMQLKRLRRPHIQMTIGPAFRLPPVGRDSRERDLQTNSEEIMCRIAALLPEKYRGVYADAPRVKELTREDIQPTPAQTHPERSSKNEIQFAHTPGEEA
jgi:1-acyl-sn-glycerol-3-phosphate acyltransferase